MLVSVTGLFAETILLLFAHRMYENVEEVRQQVRSVRWLSAAVIAEEMKGKSKRDLDRRFRNEKKV